MASQIDLIKRVREIIINNRYLTLSTCNNNNAWIAPLAYYVESDYSFVYYSSKESKHSLDIQNNPQVACSIYDSSLPSDSVDGIQFIGKVEEVPINELINVVPKYFMQSFPVEKIRAVWQQPVSNFKGLTIKKFYRIIPANIYTIDLDTTEVDKRVEVDLEELKKIPMIK